MNKIKQLVNFLIEAGKLGNVERKLHAINSTRRENVAEYINKSTVSETDVLIWTYIRRVFHKEFEFIINKVKLSLVQE